MKKTAFARWTRRSFLIANVGAALAPWNGALWASPAPLQGGLGLSAPVITRFGTIAHRDVGHGPAALFLHAWPLHSLQWDGIMAQLGSERRCLAPDMLGLGASVAVPEVRITPAVQVDMLVAYLDALAIGSVDIVANDVGALVAQLFVARYPDRVRSLLLSNCDVCGDNPPPAFVPLAQAAARSSLADLFIRPQLADIECARSRRGIGSGLANPAALTEDLVLAYLGPLVAAPERVRQFDSFSAALGVDVLTAVQANLARFRGPVRILWGTQDRLFASRGPEVLAHAFARPVGIRLLADANLYVPLDQPDIVVQEAGQLWTKGRS